MPTEDCPDDTIAIDLPSGDTLTNAGTLSAISGYIVKSSAQEVLAEASFTLN